MGLRFAMVTTFYPPHNFGGDGHFVQRLARALVRRGHEVHVIHDTDAYRMLSGTDPELPDETDGVVVHRLRSPRPTLSALGVQQLGRPTTHLAQLEALLQGFDVINYHNISLVGGPGIWPIGDAIKLHTAHEYWMVCPTHLLWRNNREICTERACLSCQMRYRRPPQIWRGLGRIARDGAHVDRFLMLSRDAEAHHREFGFPHPMTVIPSFLPNQPPLPEQDAPPRPYFFFAGRLEGQKGLQDVIPHFDDSLPADLLIAGTGAYEAELRALAADRPTVKFLGRLPMEMLRHYYRHALATVIPSQWYEVFPLVIMESLAEGTPIIGRELGPFPEVVAETGGGQVFASAPELRAILHRLAHAPEEAAKMGAAGKAGFAERWAEDVSLARYFEVIGEVARDKGRLEIAAAL